MTSKRSMTLTAWLTRRDACHAATRLIGRRGRVAAVRRCARPSTAVLVAAGDCPIPGCTCAWATASPDAKRRRGAVRLDEWRQWTADQLGLPLTASWPTISAALKRAGVR